MSNPETLSKSPMDVRARLRFEGKNVPRDEITSILGIEHNSPEIKNPIHWSYSIDGTDVNECLQDLGILIRSKREDIHEIGKRYKPLIGVSIFYDSDEWPIVCVKLSPDTLQLLAEIGIPFYFTIFAQVGQDLDAE